MVEREASWNEGVAGRNGKVQLACLLGHKAIIVTKACFKMLLDVRFMRMRMEECRSRKARASEAIRGRGRRFSLRERAC